MAKTTKTRIAFVGNGYSTPTRTMEKSETQLTIDACLAAAAEAGMDPTKVDGINVQVHHYPPPETDEIIKGIGMENARWVKGGGGLGMGPTGEAALAIENGECDSVFMIKIMNTIAPVATPQIDPGSGGVAGPSQFEVPFGLGYSMQRIGLTGRRYMNRYGITSEQLGWVAVTAREHAIMNPYGYQKTPITIEDYMASRFIADPVRLLDCDIPVNGAWAYLMTREDIARDAKTKPVFLTSWATSKVRKQDHLLTETLEGMHPLAEEMYRDAGMGPKEMDLWYPYDGFSFFVLHWLENLGLVGRGEAGAYVEGGERISYTGEHPMNTHGGNLSGGRMHGHGHLMEAVEQLRGTAGARQTKNAKTAVISSVFPETGAAGILQVD